MKPHPHSEGKILPADPNQAGDTRIEQRAQELAEIRGSGHRYTRDDWEQAERELRGKDLPIRSQDDDIAEASANRDPSDPAANRGHQVPNMEAEDENAASAGLAMEGSDEAQHELMLAARRRRQQP